MISFATWRKCEIKIADMDDGKGKRGRSMRNKRRFGERRRNEVEG